jgi:hypothetical protein
VKVKLRSPDREVEVTGGREVHDVLGERLGEREVAMETSNEVFPAEIYAAGRPS